MQHFKKIAAYGISVISTDFAAMGAKIAEMVINQKTFCTMNSGLLTGDRFNTSKKMLQSVKCR